MTEGLADKTTLQHKLSLSHWGINDHNAVLLHMANLQKLNPPYY